MNAPATNSEAAPAKRPASALAKSRAFAFSAVGIASFSLTLLAGSIAVFTGLIPLHSLSLGDRADVGTVLFVAPVLALVLGVVFEATRIALTRSELPEPRRRQAVVWTPASGNRR